jgi:hypothetical protein
MQQVSAITGGFVIDYSELGTIQQEAEESIVKTHFSPPLDMDQECVFLCIALNKLPGIKTVSSCCGHGIKPFYISFTAERIDDILPVCYWSDPCHLGFPGWIVAAVTDCSMEKIMFVLEGRPFAYAAAHKMAQCIEEWLAGADERADHPSQTISPQKGDSSNDGSLK